MSEHATIPSIEEISFKLTDQLIPDLSTSQPTLIAIESSLEYTVSRISIHLMLQECGGQHQNQQSQDWKQSLLDSTNTNATLSSLKHSQNLGMRHRAVSCRHSQGTPQMGRKLSMHVLNLQNQCPTARSSLAGAIEQNCLERPPIKKSNYRRQNRLGIRKMQEVFSNRQIKAGRVLELARSIQIKQLTLKENLAKEKIYLQRIILNRASTVHPIHEISRFPPLCTRKAH